MSYGNGYSGGAEDTVFRRVRGILNKLTVENFDSLSDQLVRVGISNENVLKGIIILLFEKAVDEPKFCPIYAGVCRRLSEQGPNFEEPDPSAVAADGTASRKPPTFLKLLLRKCQDEFENRSRAEKLAQKAGLVSGLVPGSEEHRKTLAAHAELKQCRAKMLGNITFIGELGKRGLLSEKVLHECIRRLCDNVTDPAFEDIECLCHLLRTVGLQLDHDKAKSYMDQYFSRMKMMRKIDTLPSRIKFMLDDVVEMRDNQWEERKLQKAHKEGPKSIREIRLQAMEEQLQASGNKREKQIGLQRIRLLRQEMRQEMAGGANGMEMGMGMGGGMMGSMAPPSYQSREHGIPSQPGMFSGMKRSEPLFPEYLQQQQQQQGYGDQGGQGSYNQDVRMDGYGGGGHQQQQQNGGQRRNSPQLARLKIGQNISLRPGSELGRGRPQGPAGMQQQQQQQQQQSNQPGRISTVNSKLPTDKKGKKLSKAQLEKQSASLVEEYLSVRDAAEAIKCFNEMKTPKYAPKFIVQAIMIGLDMKETDRATISKLVGVFHEAKIATDRHVIEAFEQVLQDCPDLAIDIPKVETYLAGMASQWVVDGVVSFGDLADALKLADNAKTVFASLIEQLVVAKGEADTKALFEAAEVDLLDVLPPDRRNEDELSALLKRFNLTFLYPMMRMKEDFVAELQSRFPAAITEPESAAVGTEIRSIFKWLKSLPVEMSGAETFIRVVAQCVLGHVAAVTTMTPHESPEHYKQLKVDEKNTFQAFGAILQNYAGDEKKTQTEIIYALQLLCVQHKFPKGLMLRMAGHLYDLDIVEEESWSSWREEVNVEVQGKGDALVAVNEYLNWMRTAAAESSDEDESGDESDGQ